jgi:hypothetical protein
MINEGIYPLSEMVASTCSATGHQQVAPELAEGISRRVLTKP